MAKLSICLICLPLLAAGACATTSEPAHLAATECKVTVAQPGTIRGRAPEKVSDLDRQHAVSRLATSDLRMRMLTRGGAPGLIEDVLRDCYR